MDAVVPLSFIVVAQLIEENEERTQERKIRKKCIRQGGAGHRKGEKEEEDYVLPLLLWSRSRSLVCSCVYK